jgi:hypothetical protein
VCLKVLRAPWLLLLAAACATSQGSFRRLGSTYPPLPVDQPIQVFEKGRPEKPFIEVSRVDAHFEKTMWMGTSLETALEELKRQARLSGAEALIDVAARESMVGETRIFHVTAIGIRFTEVDRGRGEGA